LQPASGHRTIIRWVGALNAALAISVFASHLDALFPTALAQTQTRKPFMGPVKTEPPPPPFMGPLKPAHVMGPQKPGTAPSTPPSKPTPTAGPVKPAGTPESKPAPAAGPVKPAAAPGSKPTPATAGPVKPETPKPANAPTAKPAASTTTASALPPGAPAYSPTPIPDELQKEFAAKGYKLEPKSGNYLSPGIFARTPKEDMVPLRIAGAYVKDERGNQVFLRSSLVDKLLMVDEQMVQEKHKHILVGYGFRSNALQYEIYQKLTGHAKVAPAGSSFHETGMAIDVLNTDDAHKFLIKAGFAGGCDGIGEDKVHYSVGEIDKASNGKIFARCTMPNLLHTIFGKK
jgi:hypothetical protein